MSFDYSKLKGRIVEKCGSQREFARVLGVSENILSEKMNCKTRFTSDDIIKTVRILDIATDDIGAYFFSEKV